MSGDRSETINWTNERRRLSDLKPWPRNPRQIKADQARRLADSFDQFGQVETIAVGPDNEIYNGHQRLNVLMDAHGPDYEVDVRVASRPLTERQREQLTVYLHKGAAGEWDFDILANEFELDDLLDWGFQGWELGVPDEGIDYDEHWKDMPEFEQDDAMGDYHTIKVHFMDTDGLERFSELVGQSVTEKTKYIWYPKQERTNLKKLAVIDES